MLESGRAALDDLDRIVQERVLGERVVRVKIWDAEGRIVYSDEPRLIGSRYPLDGAKLEVLRTGSARAELSDLSGPENRFERDEGSLYEVYLRSGRRTGLRPLRDVPAQRLRRLDGAQDLGSFAGLLLASLVLLWLVQVPLAARPSAPEQPAGPRGAPRPRGRGFRERRRIAADLHDGVVQDRPGSRTR